MSQVNELRKDEVTRSSQAADQNAPSEEAGESHVRRACSTIAADQCEMRWLSKGNSALRGGKNETKESLIRDILHLQWSAVEEGLSDGLEGVSM